MPKIKSPWFKGACPKLGVVGEVATESVRSLRGLCLKGGRRGLRGRDLKKVGVI